MAKCKILWRSVKPLLRYGNFSIFSQWLLDLLCAFEPPQTVFGGVYHLPIGKYH